MKSPAAIAWFVSDNSRRRVERIRSLLNKSRKKRPQSVTMEPLEPRLLLSVSPVLVGTAATFSQDLLTSDALYLRSTTGQMQWSTDGSTWSNDFDLGTSGTQTLSATGGVTITSHVAGNVHLESILTTGG